MTRGGKAMNLESYKERLQILLEQEVISQKSYDVSLQAFEQLMEAIDKTDIEQAEMLFTHLPMALERRKKGEEFPSPSLEIKREVKGSIHYDFAVEQVRMVEELLDDSLPEGEKQFLYMHFTNVLNINL